MTVKAGTFTVVTGIPNHGKSEFLDALAVNVTRLHGWKFAICSFENDPAEHLTKLAEKFLHAPFWDGPTLRARRHEVTQALAWLNERFVFIRADGEESPTIDWLIGKAQAAVLRHGVRGLIADPWNELEHRRPTGVSETEYASDVLGRLRRFARTRDCAVWLVAHPTKLMREDGKLPSPGLYDISGSAHFANKCDVGFAVHRPDRDQPITEIHVHKVRHKWLGKRGMVQLNYDVPTGEYREIELALPTQRRSSARQ